MDWSVLAPIIVSTVASTAFTLLYGLRSRWRSNPVGKLQFAKSASMAAVFWLILINSLVDDYWFRDFISHTIYWSLALALCWQVWMLLRIQAGKVQGPNYGRRCDDMQHTHTDKHV